jgi:hypothetical protein
LSEPKIFRLFAAPGGAWRFDFPAQVDSYIKFLAGETGEELECEIRKRKSKRSERQNKGFHAMLQLWAREEGHRIDDLKRDLLKEVFGTLESVSLVTGEVTEVLAEPHTSTLTVAQFSELIERTLEIAARMGVILVPPDEWRRQQAEQARAAERAARKLRR